MSIVPWYNKSSIVQSGGAKMLSTCIRIGRHVQLGHSTAHLGISTIAWAGLVSLVPPMT